MKQDFLGEIRVKKTVQQMTTWGRVCRVLMNPKQLAFGVLRRLKLKSPEISWSERAESLGPYGVIDTRHHQDEYGYVTEEQRKLFVPFLKSLRTRNEVSILDYGCGPGRFTKTLLDVFSETSSQPSSVRVWGFDVASYYFRFAPQDDRIAYFSDFDSVVENLNSQERTRFDIIWVCLVLGGLRGEELKRACTRFVEHLKDDGRLLLIEATCDENNLDGAWAPRTESQIKELFPNIEFSIYGRYLDAGQIITLFIGKKIHGLSQ